MDLRPAARAGIVTALVAVVLAGAAPGAAAAAGPGRAFFGMQGWTVPTARDFAIMRRGGVGMFRTLFVIPPKAMPLDALWATYDPLMASAARAGIEVLPVLIGGPAGGQRFKRPRTRAERTVWGDDVRALAARYGRGGAFWAAHPELPPTPPTAYQVWNEPNLPVYWSPADDAAGYLRLVRLTRARLRAVDPRALIVLAGLPDSRLGVPMLDYVRALYAQPGARQWFDVLAVHPYAADAAGVLGKLNRVRAQMDRRGDRGTPIWVTEIGWGTGGLPSPYRTSRLGQAVKVGRTYRALIAARGRLRLGRLILLGLQDRMYVEGESRWWGPRVGLFDVAGHPKPAWRTFVGITGGQPGGRLRSVVGPVRRAVP